MAPLPSANDENLNTCAQRLHIVASVYKDDEFFILEER